MGWKTRAKKFEEEHGYYDDKDFRLVRKNKDRSEIWENPEVRFKRFPGTPAYDYCPFWFVVGSKNDDCANIGVSLEAIRKRAMARMRYQKRKEQQK